MRLPFPDRFETKYVMVFIAVLFLVQQIEGTNPLFSFLAAIFIGLWAAAFNIAGGLSYPSGAYIFFNGLLGAVVGMTYKAMLGEASETHLASPIKTMLCYCVGMMGMGIAAFLVKSLRPRIGLVQNLFLADSMKRAAIGCLLIGITTQYLTEAGYNEAGSAASAFRQLNHFLQLSIILATTYEIRHTKGKRSTNWIVWIAGTYIFVIGLSGFSKEGIFTGPVSWLLPALALRFDFPKKTLLFMLGAAFLANFYLVPYSQYGRQYRDEAGNRTVQILAAVPLLLHLDETRRLYRDGIDEMISDDAAPHYFSADEGIFEREQMLAYDDAIITFTDEGNVFGLSPVYISFINAIPHFLWPNKPTIYSGNAYGRELGVIGAEDVTTGISFGPTGDAYHEAKWFGVAFVLPMVLIFCFFVTDALTGSARYAPWALLPIVMSVNYAPQGLMQGAIYLATYGNLAVILTVVLARYVLPMVTNLLMGSERTRVRRTIDFKPMPSRGRLRQATVGSATEVDPGAGGS